MKNKSLILAALGIFLFQRCKDVIVENDLRNVPVYMTYEELRSSIKIENATELKNPGKLYFKDGLIFINEKMKGIHVIDNSNPKNPSNKAFIKIPGNIDMAIKNNVLYADSYIDLVAIDITDYMKPSVLQRIEEAFPYTVPQIKDPTLLLAEIDEKRGVVSDWKIEYSKMKIEQKNYPEYSHYYYPNYYYNGFDGAYLLNSAYYGVKQSGSAGSGTTGSGSGSQQGVSFGIGGSMARFGLYNDYLYVIDNKNFHIFDVTNPMKPYLKKEFEAGNDVETMFIHDNHMFLGTMDGMLVYSLKNPETPVEINSYSHIRSCDPVVVDNYKAYVTLRAGTECGGTVSRLDILQLNGDYTTSNLLNSMSMSEPYGLGIDGKTLFVCDKREGLIVFDVSNPTQLYSGKLAQFKNIKAYDVIPLNSNLFMIGDDGFYQYDYSDVKNIKQISVIPVMKP